MCLSHAPKQCSPESSGFESTATLLYTFKMKSKNYHKALLIAERFNYLGFPTIFFFVLFSSKRYWLRRLWIFLFISSIDIFISSEMLWIEDILSSRSLYSRRCLFHKHSLISYKVIKSLVSWWLNIHGVINSVINWALRGVKLKMPTWRVQLYFDIFTRDYFHLSVTLTTLFFHFQKKNVWNTIYGVQNEKMNKK